MRQVERRHRLAPVKKLQSDPVRGVMQGLSLVRLERTPGFAPGNPDVQAGLVQMLASGRAATTDKVYCNAFERVRKWSQRVGVCALPMLPFHFMRYLWALYEHSTQRGLARGNIDMACAAVERFHTLAGHVSPTSDMGVQEIRKGMGRALGIRGQQAFPLTDGVQERMWRWCAQQGVASGNGLLHFVTLLTVAVMREGVMRWDDVARVEFRDVLITEQYARVFVSERKTDTQREGVWVMLPRREQPWAAYQLLLQVPLRFAAEFQRLSVVQRCTWLGGHLPLSTWQSGEGTIALNPVRVACQLEKVHEVWLPVAAGVSLQYNRFQDLFRQLLGFVGEDPSMYSTHSMRRGGASELRQRGLPEDVIAQHGGWKSRSSMLKYFDGSVEFARRAAALRQATVKSAQRGEDHTDVAKLRDLF